MNMNDLFPSNGTNPVTGKPYKYAVVMDNLVFAGAEEEKQALAQFEMFTDRRPSTSKQWVLKNQETGTIVRGPTSNPTGKNVATSVASLAEKKTEKK